MPKRKQSKGGRKGGNDPALNEKDPAKRIKILLERRINDAKLSNGHRDVISPKLKFRKFHLFEPILTPILANFENIQEKRSRFRDRILLDGNLQIYIP